MYELLYQVQRHCLEAALLQVVRQKARPLALRMIDQDLLWLDVLYHPHQPAKVQVITQADRRV